METFCGCEAHYTKSAGILVFLGYNVFVFFFCSVGFIPVSIGRWPSRHLWGVNRWMLPMCLHVCVRACVCVILILSIMYA